MVWKAMILFMNIGVLPMCYCFQLQNVSRYARGNPAADGPLIKFILGFWQIVASYLSTKKYYGIVQLIPEKVEQHPYFFKKTTGLAQVCLSMCHLEGERRELFIIYA